MDFKMEDIEFIRDLLKDVMKIGVRGFYLDKISTCDSFESFSLDFKELEEKPKRQGRKNEKKR